MRHGCIARRRHRQPRWRPHARTDRGRRRRCHSARARSLRPILTRESRSRSLPRRHRTGFRFASDRARSSTAPRPVLPWPMLHLTRMGVVIVWNVVRVCSLVVVCRDRRCARGVGATLHSALLDAHAGWRRLRSLQSAGRTARRTRGGGAELVDGHARRASQGRHQIGFNAMLSLDPATVGRSGYRRDLSGWRDA